MSLTDSSRSSRKWRVFWHRRIRPRYIAVWIALSLAISGALVSLIWALQPQPAIVIEHTSVIWQSSNRIDSVIYFRHDGSCLEGVWEHWVRDSQGDHFMIVPPREVVRGDPNIYLKSTRTSRYFRDELRFERYLEPGEYFYQGRVTCTDNRGGQQPFVTQWRPFHVPVGTRGHTGF